jgi:chemotaxis protein methyltransferase CheR
MTAAKKMISSRAFEKISGLVRNASGIHLNDGKKQLVASRLSKRLRHLNIADYESYFDECVSSPVELQTMINTITTNETSFFREPHHFEFMRNSILPNFTGRKFRVWSAASSIGAEAYSAAMVLDEELTHLGIEWEVLGTDINTEVIEQASQGLYPMRFAEQIGSKYLKKYCLKGTGPKEGQFLINDYLRSKVRFQTMNLMKPIPLEIGKFDLVFLRNMLIYFDGDNKKAIVKNTLEALKPSGYFFIGHSESINSISNAVRQIKPTVYTKPGVN